MSVHVCMREWTRVCVCVYIYIYERERKRSVVLLDTEFESPFPPTKDIPFY